MVHIFNYTNINRNIRVEIKWVFEKHNLYLSTRKTSPPHNKFLQILNSNELTILSKD